MSHVQRSRRAVAGGAVCAALVASALVPSGAVASVTRQAQLPASATSSSAKSASPPADVSAQALPKCPEVVAHRGGVAKAPGVTENSMAAFRRAVSLGVWAVETDVRLTKDRVPVLMHDETINRTTRGSGKVSDYTYRQLRKVRLNNGQRIPKLAKLLRLLQRTGTWGFIEYKGADRARNYRPYLDTIRTSQAKVYGASFSPRLMRWLNRKEPNLPLMWFGLNTSSSLASQLAQVPDSVEPGLNNASITSDRVAELRSLGKHVNVWFSAATRSDKPSGGRQLRGQGWEGMTQAGVSWVTTDRPARYLSWTSRSRQCAVHSLVSFSAPIGIGLPLLPARGGEVR